MEGGLWAPSGARLWTPVLERITSPGEELRVAVIGAGGHISDAAHIPNLRTNRDVKIVTLMNIRRSLAVAARDRFALADAQVIGADDAVVDDPRTNLAALGADLLAETIRESSAQAAVICTPTHTHYAVAKALIEADKHVLVEKPLAETYPEATELASLQERHGVVVATGYQLLWDLAAGEGRRIKENLRGEIEYARARWIGWGRHPTSLAYADTGALLDIGVHPTVVALELMDWPMPESVDAAMHYDHPEDPWGNVFGPYDPAQFRGETRAYCWYTFPGGARLLVRASYFAPEPHEKVEVRVDGPGRYGATIPFQTVLTGQADYSPRLLNEVGILWEPSHLGSPIPRNEETWRAAQTRHWVHLCLGVGEGCCRPYVDPPYIDAHKGAQLAWMVDGARQSAHEGRWVDLRRPGA
jgi:predicted dehydrogenase